MNLILKIKKHGIQYHAVGNDGEHMLDIGYHKSKEDVYRECEIACPAGKRVHGGFMIPVRYMFDRDDMHGGWK
jgi:hypothetical protein